MHVYKRTIEALLYPASGMCIYMYTHQQQQQHMCNIARAWSKSNVCVCVCVLFSEPDNHMFEKFSAHKPTMCSECNYILWGLMKQGVKCKSETLPPVKQVLLVVIRCFFVFFVYAGCGKICHDRCSSLASQDCSSALCVHSESHSTCISSLPIPPLPLPPPPPLPSPLPSPRSRVGHS